LTYNTRPSCGQHSLHIRPFSTRRSSAPSLVETAPTIYDHESGSAYLTQEPHYSLTAQSTVEPCLPSGSSRQCLSEPEDASSNIADSASTSAIQDSSDMVSVINQDYSFLGAGGEQLFLEPGSLIQLSPCSGYPSGWMTAFYDVLHLSLGLSWPLTIFISSLTVTLASGCLLVASTHFNAGFRIRTEAVAAELREFRVKGSPQPSIWTRKAFRLGDMLISLSLHGASIIFPLSGFMGLSTAMEQLVKLPLPELINTPWAWLPSLAASDPYYVLPFIFAITLQTLLQVLKPGIASYSLGSTTRTLVNCMPIICAVSLASTPSVQIMHMIVGVGTFGLLGSVARWPAARKALGFTQRRERLFEGLRYRVPTPALSTTPPSPTRPSTTPPTPTHPRASSISAFTPTGLTPTAVTNNDKLVAGRKFLADARTQLFARARAIKKKPDLRKGGKGSKPAGG
jgi:hypothetical protein